MPVYFRILTYRDPNTSSSPSHDSAHNHKACVSPHRTQRIPKHIPRIAKNPNYFPARYLAKCRYQEWCKTHAKKVAGQGDLRSRSAYVEIMGDLPQRWRDHAGRHDGYELSEREDCSDKDFAIGGPVVGV
jgi:hypothetical protein